jgi:hypothetical protein
MPSLYLDWYLAPYLQSRFVRWACSTNARNAFMQQCRDVVSI